VCPQIPIGGPARYLGVSVVEVLCRRGGQFRTWRTGTNGNADRYDGT
jgi:hypothetical protein